MNENENNFDALRQLLKLKRHELPPPGFFNNFSSQIIARIRAGEAAEVRTNAGVPWLLKFLQLFEFKPAFAGAFAGALGLLLVFGIIYAERPDNSTPQPTLQNAEPAPVSFAAAAPALLPQPMNLPQPADSIGLVAGNNTTTSLQPVASLFGSQNVFAQPVSFSPSGQ
jgi:hypothetical protein